MNKEVIKKYKKEFDRWLDGGKILCKYVGIYPDGRGWQEKPYVWETNDEYIIVINDEYVEFRKALAEGKTVIIVDDDSPHGDIGIREVKCMDDLKSVHERHLRIKPDETFKVGDYVKFEDGIIFQVEYITSSEDLGYEINGSACEVVSTYCKLWTLEEADDDEWMLFNWNDDVYPSDKDMLLIQVKVFKKRYSEKERYNVVPYIGQSAEQLGLEK